MTGKALEELNRVVAQVAELKALVDQNHKWTKIELDGKASVLDLQSVQNMLLERVSELVRNFEEMFADKESTRKKFSAIDKLVRTAPFDEPFVVEQPSTADLCES